MAEIQESREELVRTPRGVVRETVTSSDNPARRYSAAERIISIITSTLLALLAIRVVLSLLGANRGNPFAEFIYGFTYPFVAPFFGLFGYTMQYGAARLELETLIAMAFYALVGYGLAHLVGVGRLNAHRS
jgi:YggT family protein